MSEEAIMKSMIKYVAKNFVKNDLFSILSMFLAKSAEDKAPM